MSRRSSCARLAGLLSVALCGCEALPGTLQASLEISPTSTAFGHVAPGASSQATFSVTNSGRMPAKALQLALSGADYALASSDCLPVLAGGASCAVQVQFTPTTGGLKAATLSAAAADGLAASATLSGAAMQASLAISPSSTTLGPVALGSSSEAIFSVSNAGSAAATALVFAVTGADYALGATDCQAVLPGGSACTVRVRFTPTAPGARPASLTATADAGLAATATLVGTGTAAPGKHTTARRFGGAGTDALIAVGADGAGNVVIGGCYQTSVDLGGGVFPSAGQADLFLAQYDANGALRWSKHFGNTGQDCIQSLAIDASGNIAAVGYFSGTVDFGGGPLTSAGAGDVFIVKYDTNGVHKWSRRAGGPSDDDGIGVAVDGQGNVTVAGYFWGSIDLGGGALSSAGLTDAFVAQYDANGAHRWSKRLGGTDGDYARDVAVDGSGNVFVVGDFRGTAAFGGTPFVSAGDYDAFVAKFGADGTPKWSKRLGGPGLDRAWAVAAGASGDVAVVGDFSGTSSVGGAPMTSAGGQDGYIARFDANGTYLWSMRYGGAGDDIPFGTAMSPSGDVLLTGMFTASVDFGGGPLASAGSSDFFVACLDAAGAHKWSRRFGGTGADSGNSVVFGPAGTALAVGSFSGTVDFGDGPLTSAGQEDAVWITVVP